MAEKSSEPVMGRRWLDEEVECMLKILHKSGGGRRVMTSTHMETLSLFEEVVAEMLKKGYHKSASQARSKFKREKSNFFMVMQRSDGHPPPGERPPRFDLLRRLWIQADRPHWAYRFAGGSSGSKRSKRKIISKPDVELLSSEEDEGEEKETLEGNDDVVVVEEEEVGEVDPEDKPSTSKASVESLSKSQQMAYESQEEGAVQGKEKQAKTESRRKRKPDWAESLERRMDKIEGRLETLEQLTNAIAEQGGVTRRDVDQLESMKQMHTKAIVTLRQMVNFNRICTGVRPPKGEEPVLPFIDDDDV